jgi:hypothetical protein
MGAGGRVGRFIEVVSSSALIGSRCRIDAHRYLLLINDSRKMREINSGTTAVSKHATSHISWVMVATNRFQVQIWPVSLPGRLIVTI